MTREQMIAEIESITGLHVGGYARAIDIEDLLYTVRRYG